jgi:hypothetical protein
VGVFTAAWDDDPDEPVVYEGSATGLDYLRTFLKDRMVTGSLGRRLTVEGLEPNDLTGFCVSAEYGINVIVDFDTLWDEADEA